MGVEVDLVIAHVEVMPLSHVPGVRGRGEGGREGKGQTDRQSDNKLLGNIYI